MNHPEAEPTGYRRIKPELADLHVFSDIPYPCL
ncbi:MAG: hypothetical protein UT91_C0035G0001, partial [Parcubacteria group bacterium GW2011_GWA2_40_23]